MDPALGITSPFRNEAKSTDGVLDCAIQSITARDPAGEWSANLDSLHARDTWSIQPASVATHRTSASHTASEATSGAAHVQSTHAAEHDEHKVAPHCLSDACATNHTDSDAPHSGGAERANQEIMPDTKTECMICGANSTYVKVPMDGFYICPDCNIQRRCRNHRPVYPLSTFKCCPDVIEEGDSGVVRCHHCGQWYHCSCVGMTSSVIRQHVGLSTTRWYCPEPGCCESHLASQLKIT